MTTHSRLHTLFGLLITTFLLGACKTQDGASPNTFGTNGGHSGRGAIYTQAEIDSDQYEVFLAEERLWDDNVVFVDYGGFYEFEIYCCTLEDIQIDSLVHYIEKATTVLSKYSGSFLISEPGLAPYRASLSPYYIQSIEQKLSAAQQALNTLYAPGPFGKAKKGRKPLKPQRPQVAVQKAE